MSFSFPQLLVTILDDDDMKGKMVVRRMERLEVVLDRVMDRVYQQSPLVMSTFIIIIIDYHYH